MKESLILLMNVVSDALSQLRADLVNGVDYEPTLERLENVLLELQSFIVNRM